MNQLKIRISKLLVKKENLEGRQDRLFKLLQIKPDEKSIIDEIRLIHRVLQEVNIEIDQLEKELRQHND